MTKSDKDGKDFVRPTHSDVHLNQTGSGKHGDRRTKRRRDRSTRERTAREESRDDQ